MDGGVIAVVIATCVAILALIAFLIRSSLREHDRLRDEVRRSDEAMRWVADQLGLEVANGAVYSHPTVGDVPAFGSVRGVLRKIPVHVLVASDDGEPVRFHTELRADPPPEGWAGAEERLPELARGVPEAERLAIQDGRLCLVPRVRETGSISYRFAVLSDPVLLGTMVEALVGIASDLGAPRGYRA